MSLSTLAVLSAANSVHTQRWVNALSKFFQVTLFSLDIHRDVTHAIENSVEVIYLPSSGKLSYFKAHKELNRLSKERHFDVYNAQYASGYGTILRLSRRKPAVLNFWGSDIFDFPNKTPLHKWILRKNTQSANVIVSTSKIMADEIKRVFPSLRTDIYVVPFGVELEKFKYKQRKIHCDVRLGTCKMLSPIYAIDDMIKAFAIVRETQKKAGRKLTLELFGDGPSRAQLEQLVTELSLEDSVTFHGWIEHKEIPKALESLDIFLLTSITESFGVSAIEAMAVGLPVVATKTPGFSEVILDGVTGSLVSVHDFKALSIEISRLLDNEVLYQAYSQAGRARVEEKYNWADNVKQFVEILHTTINSLRDNR